MFISVAMRKTGLDRRIAMLVLSSVGTKVSRIYLGCYYYRAYPRFLRTQCNSSYCLLSTDYHWYC